MSKYKEKPLNPQELNSYSLKDRRSKVEIQSFAHTWSPGDSFQQFVESLPDILGGRDFKQFLQHCVQAKTTQKSRIFAMGAHVIKVGLNPVLIDLMKAEWISCLVLNGAGIIHDFELAFSGKTSEDVQENIQDGKFGVAEETGQFLNQAIKKAAASDIGIGEAIGKAISESDFPHKSLSLLATAYELNIPVTVHVAIGTDTIHFHPEVHGEALGKSSLQDFFLLCECVRNLDGGGIYFNAGSAVVLPEVFLKAVSYVRNQDFRLRDFHTAVFDFIHHYRPHENVVTRPLQGEGQGFYFVGQHELLIPLFAAALKSADSTP